MSRPALQRDQRGAALIELPLAVLVLILMGLVSVGLADLLVGYHHLASASAAAARYATKSEFDPTTGAFRPTTGAVQAYAESAAGPVAGPVATLTDAGGAPADNRSGRPGDEVTVSVAAPIQDPALSLFSSIVDGPFSLVHLRPLPTTVTVHASTTAAYE